ncbi:MAG: hypothetical protein LBP85_01345 [Prevotellaceae bacterium]|jgi:hypothetical protein|nr:hypothetical protein [Prevotellaceae bacterium]
MKKIMITLCVLTCIASNAKSQISKELTTAMRQMWEEQCKADGTVHGIRR